MPLLTANMGLNVPVLNDPSPGYVNNILASFTAVDAHNHTTGQGAPIPFGALTATSDLPFGGNRATQLLAATFSNLTSQPTTASTLGGLYVLNGDLWYMNVSGSAVRVTSGTALAPAPVPPTIGGDFTAVNAAVTYTNSTQTYAFYTASSAALANLSLYNLSASTVTAGSFVANGTVAVSSASNYVFTTPQTVTYNVNLAKGINGYATAVEANTLGQLVFPASTNLLYYVNVPNPASGTLTALRLYLTASGTITGSATLWSASTRASATSQNLGTMSLSGSRSGDFSVSLTGLNYSASPTGKVFLAFSASSSAASFTVIGAEADWLTSVMPTTAS